MKKSILFVVLISACGSPPEFFEDFESYNVGDTTPYVVEHFYNTDEVVNNVSDSQSYKMTQSGIYQYCIPDDQEVLHASFELMVSQFENSTILMISLYNFYIRLDGSVLNGATFDFLLKNIWHQIDLTVDKKNNKIIFVLDGNKHIEYRNNLDEHLNCLTFILNNQAIFYIDNIHIY